jgi:hypothetical protein
MAAAAGRGVVFAACLLAGFPAGADEAPRTLPAMGDVIHKGLVGKALDVVPMDPEERVVLRRTSAVVSGTLTGRSFSVWAGVTHPLLMVAGLVWGIYSALNIKGPETAQPGEDLRPPEATPTGHVMLAKAPEDH